MSFYSEMSASVGDPKNINRPNDNEQHKNNGFWDKAAEYANGVANTVGNFIAERNQPATDNGYWDGANYIYNGTGQAPQAPQADLSSMLPTPVQIGNGYYNTDNSIDPSSPGVPIANGQFGAQEDPAIRQARMQDTNNDLAANWPRAFGALTGAVGGMGAVVGGIQNAIGAGDTVARNVDTYNQGLQKYRDQWNETYGDNYLLNPSGIASDIGSGIGSSAPILALSALMPGAAVAGGSKAITAALERAGLGKLAQSAAGKALIEDVVRSPISSLADSAAEKGNVQYDLMQDGMSEDEAKKRANTVFWKNMLLDTATIPAELSIMKGAKGITNGVITPKVGESLGQRLGKAGLRTGILSTGSGLTEGYQEGTQQALENQASGGYDGYVANPLSWGNDEWNAARGGFVGGAVLGAPGNIATAVNPVSDTTTEDHGSTSTDNPMLDTVIQAANDAGEDPRLAVAIGARESGGDDPNAINMANNGGIMQVTEESAKDYGINELYPDWREDPYQNVRAGLYILQRKREENGGDAWAGVRSYNGAGPDADAYLTQVQKNYENMPDLGNMGSESINIPAEQYYTVSDADGVNVADTDLTKQKMNLLARDYYNQYGKNLWITSMKRDGDGSSWHDSGQAFDTADDTLESDSEARKWLIAQGEKYGLTALDEYENPSANATGGHIHFSDHGDPIKGMNNGGGRASLDTSSEDEAYEKKQGEIQKEYDTKMNALVNENNADDAYDEVQKEMAAAQDQQEKAAKSLAPKDKSKELNDYVDTVVVDDIGDDAYNEFFSAAQADPMKDSKQIDRAYRRMRVNKAVQNGIEMATQRGDTDTAGKLSQALKDNDMAAIKELLNQFKNPAPEQAPVMPAPPTPMTTPLPQQQQQQAAQQAQIESIGEPADLQKTSAAPALKTEPLGRQAAPKAQAAFMHRKAKLMERIPTGSTERVHATASDDGMDATYKVVPAADITASHNTDFSQNPFYPAELQPRDRQRGTMQNQVNKMANTIKPELLGQSQFVNEGAPVVNKSGVVLNGNGRTMAIKKAYEGNRESAQRYKEYLRANAVKFGLTTAQIDSIPNPVLVRQVSNDADVNAITKSTEGGARLGAAEQAKSDADKLKLSTLEQFVDNGTGEIMNPANRKFRRVAAHDLATDTDANAFYNEHGDLTPQGRDRIKNAIFAKAYHDDLLLAKLSESTDNNSKNIMNAMMAAAPQVAQVNEGIKNGTLYDDYDISTTIADTAKTIMSLRDAGKPLNFYLKETSLFDGKVKLSEHSILEFIDRNKFKSRDIAEMYKGACERIFAVGSPAQQGLFGAEEAPRITLEDIVNNAINEVERNGIRSELPILEGQADEGRQRTQHAEFARSGRVHQQEASRVPQEEGGRKEDGASVNEREKDKAEVKTAYKKPSQMSDVTSPEPNVRNDSEKVSSTPNVAQMQKEVNDSQQAAATSADSHTAYIQDLLGKGIINKTDIRRRYIQSFGVKDMKYFNDAYQEATEGANNNANDSTDNVAERTGKGADQNTVGRNDEGQEPGNSSGSRGKSASAGQEEHLDGDRGIRDSGAVAGRTAGDSTVQAEESDDNANRPGSPQLSRSVTDSLEGVPDDEARRDRDITESVENGRNDEAAPTERAIKKPTYRSPRAKRIQKAIPQLLPEQANDVDFAEERLSDNKGVGVLFTNGTGTGKTFTGLGIAKQYYKQGKKDILIAAPNTDIIKQWMDAAHDVFDIPLQVLDSKTDKGKGPIVTTYANLGDNHVITGRKFDLVITDESHTLMSSESGKKTKALETLRALTNHDQGFERWFDDTHQEDTQKRNEAWEKYKEAQTDKAENTGELKKKYEEQNAEYRRVQDEAQKSYQGESKAKVVFLSATPFPYVADVDYASGYLFEYGDKRSDGYNQASAKEQFFIDNFGYRMRYNKLTRPDADVDNGVMERQFHDQLRQSGALSGRVLTSNYDYDRGFILVDGGVGKKIDDGLSWLRDHREFADLYDYIDKRFNYHSKMYLLEAIKAKESIPLIKEYMKSGKKVVVFHGYKKGGATHPFKVMQEELSKAHSETAAPWSQGEFRAKLKAQYASFSKERPDLVSLNMDELQSPIELFTKTFGDELALINGDMTKRNRTKAKDSFNEDASKVKVILVQSDAGQAGICLHDTTGKHQRVEINLGLPMKPVAAIQQEGRIYRVGNKSNAIFRYLNTGTMMEQSAFATKIAERSSTAENLALGDQARALKEAFINAFTESQDGDTWKRYLPGSKTEGTGGKDSDYAQREAMTDFERAKSFYFAQQKKTSSTKAFEGIDYFATPEPVGQKMVEWADLKAGESALEPSAGHGAIARWLPENTNNTVVEPSGKLVPRLQMTTPNAKTVQGTFEELHLANKFNGIVMNPPFGTGGKVAIEHLEKAFKHLSNGGRMVAIVPEGPTAQKRIDNWLYGNPDAKRKEDRGEPTAIVRAIVHMPSATFKRAGTSIRTKIVVIDKYMNEADRVLASADSLEEKTINADTIGEVFDSLENMEMPKRIMPEDGKASIRQGNNRLSRSMDNLKQEMIAAFPNAKDVSFNGNTGTIVMPNGSKIIVGLKDKIVVSDDEMKQARKAHGISQSTSNDTLILEGFSRTHGKDAYIALAQGSREGTGFHEAFHAAHDIVLTEREKAALDKHYKGDEEAQADAYVEWIEARKQGRGTMFGKLWQKIKDFAQKLHRVFTGVENIHNIMRKIEGGEVWNRTAQDIEQANTKYAVTNAKITGETQVPVIDVTDQPEVNVNSNTEKVNIAKSLIGQTFRIIGSDGIGRVATMKEGRHLVNSSKNATRTDSTRRKALSLIEKILNNSVYVEKHADVKHGTDKKYIELFAVVRDGGNLVRFRIVAREGDANADEYTVNEARFYDIIKEKTLPNNTLKGVQELASSTNVDLSAVKQQNRVQGDFSRRIPQKLGMEYGEKSPLSTISVADLLRGVKDRKGKPYVNPDGSLIYDAKMLQEQQGTKYSIRQQEEEQEIVRPQDIIDAINDIVPVYEKSKVKGDDTGDRLYNEKAEAGFSGNYFDLAQYGRILAMHLDKKLRLSGNKELTEEVTRRFQENKAADKLFADQNDKEYTPAEARREGVSEFGSYLLENPEFAADRYPQYANLFYSELAKNKELKDKFDLVMARIQAYQEQSVEQRAAANIARNGGKKPSKKDFKKWVSYQVQKSYSHWVDSTNPLGKMVRQAEAALGHKIAYEYDVQKKSLMARSNGAARAIMLLTGGRDAASSFKILNEMYGNAVIHKDTMRDVLDAMQSVSKDDLKKAGYKKAEDALGSYLIAARTEELAAKYKDKYSRPAGFSKRECVEIMNNAPTGIKKAAGHYWNVNINLVNIMQQQGMISKTLGDKLRTYKHYCPMYRDMSDGADIDTQISDLRTNYGFVNITSPVKAIDMGGKRAILDPITSMTRYVAATLNRTERNNVGKTLVKLDKDFPGLGEIIVRDPTMKSANPAAYAFSVWVNGEKVVYRTTPELYKALTDMDAASANILFQGARGIAQALRRGATISPSFITRNFIRDTIAASINSKTGFIPIVSSIKGAYKLATDKGFATAYYGSGASMSTYIRSDVQSSEKVIQDMLGTKYKDSRAGIKQIRQLFNFMWNKYDSFANLVEDSSRAAEFAGAMKKGLTIEQAGYLAKEVTLNFGRSGNYGKSVNRYVPFFNATIQGVDKFARSFQDNPKRAILATMAYIVLPSLLLWALNHDDDWYKDLDEETKLTNWAISMGDGTHLLIPKPQEAGILFGGGVEAVLRTMYDQDPKAMGEWGRQLVMSMTPSIYPAIVRPIIEWQTNYSFWTGRNLVSDRLKRLPSEMQTNNNTSEVARAAGDMWIAKKMNLSPIAIDNFISGYSGSAGRFVAQKLDAPIDAAKDKSKPASPSKYWYEMPVIGSFIRQDGANSEYINRLYDMNETISDESQRGNKPKGKEQVATAVKTVNKLTKEIRQIQSHPNMSPERKRQEIDKCRDKMRYYAKKALDRYGQQYGY